MKKTLAFDTGFLRKGILTLATALQVSVLRVASSLKQLSFLRCGLSLGLGLALHSQVLSQSSITVNDPRLLQAQGADFAFDLSQERLMGQSIAKQLYKDSSYLGDVVLQSYVEDITAALLQAASESGYVAKEVRERMLWQVFIFKEKSINAFATPGGVLGVHLGLLSQARNRDEVAAVMAHELTHVFQRHIARAMAADRRRLPLLIASMLLGAAAASKNPEAASAVLTTGQGLLAQGMLNFSRSMEREADRLGFSLLVKAGFNPLGFKTFFDKMQSVSRLNDDGQYPYLRTHPVTTERIAEIHDQLHHHTQPPTPMAVDLLPPPDAALDTDTEHSLIAARATLLADSSLESLSLAQRHISQGASKKGLSAADYYRAVYAAMLQGRFDSAISNLPALERTVTESPRAERIVKLLRWELMVAAKIPLSAAHWADFERHAAADTAWLIIASQALGAPPSAKNALLARLQTRVATHENDSLAWNALAQLYLAQQQVLRSFEAFAEREAARFDYAAAVGQLLAARDAELSIADSPQKHLQASINDSKRIHFEELRDTQRLFELSQK